MEVTHMEGEEEEEGADTVETTMPIQNIHFRTSIRNQDKISQWSFIINLNDNILCQSADME